MENQGHEQVVFVQDSDAGLTAIIAIHSTVLGPALGGTRMYPYATEEQALRDVMELSRGMTYKAAAAGLPLGGGKAVIIGDPLKTKEQDRSEQSRPSASPRLGAAYRRRARTAATTRSHRGRKKRNVFAAAASV
jgi:leucine dehydrogenase